MYPTLDFARWKTPPMPHQIEAVQWVLADSEPGRKDPVAALYHTMGVGKSKMVIDAAGELFLAGEVDTVVVFCPAAVRFNWADSDLGQVAQHSWVPTRCQVLKETSDLVPDDYQALTWVVVSYDWARSRQGAAKLRQELAGRKLLWVADESQRLQSHSAETTKQCTMLRRELKGRAVLLSGTPMGNRYILSLYSQMQFLSPEVLRYQNFFHFRARHCLMGGHHHKQVLKYFDTDLITRQLRPYVLRRTEFAQLPPKGYQVLEVPLNPGTWQLYKQMRDDMVAWLGSQPEDTSVAVNGLVRLVRLAQLTSGLIGGVNGDEERLLSTEKQDFVLGWLREHQAVEGDRRVVIWSRFRAEGARLRRELESMGRRVFALVGGQPEREREAALREFQAGAEPAQADLVGQPQAGGVGVELPAADTELFISNVESLIDRQQAEDRLRRLNQKAKHINVLDVLATGPAGQRTIDHTIYGRLRSGQELHSMTYNQWRKSLME